MRTSVAINPKENHNFPLREHLGELSSTVIKG